MDKERTVAESEEQAALVPEARLWSGREKERTREDRPGVRVKAVQRNQLVLRSVDVEQLLGADHTARAIWDLVGLCDLEPFYAGIAAVEGQAGRPASDPQLLISLWLYSYTQGIASGREIERRCGFDPAYLWLTGAEKVGAHTLTDYRTRQGEPLKDLFIQVLAVMEQEGLVDLQQVTQDGTKIRAAAGSDTFRRKGTLEEHVNRARRRVEELSQNNEADREACTRRALAARQRGAQEKLARMEKALKELEALEKQAEEPEKVRVSTTDPEARIMKENNNGYGPSYNLQLTTDASQTVIVSVDVTPDSNDAGQLQPAMDRVEKEAGQPPQQVLADGSYTNRSNIVAMEQRGVDLLGPVPDSTAQKETLYQIRGVSQEFRPEAFSFDAGNNCYTCPVGKILAYKRKNRLTGQSKYFYEAGAEDCLGCVHRPQCCGQSRKGRSLVRSEDSEEVKKFRAKMQTEAAKASYKKRGAVAEFPNLWIKEKFGMRRFSVRGLNKVKVEGLWLGLTFNVQQWIRLSWKPQQMQKQGI
jgi:transposase